jgi:hypothetical protein
VSWGLASVPREALSNSPRSRLVTRMRFCRVSVLSRARSPYPFHRIARMSSSWSSARVREEFFKFFKDRNHTFVPSSSTIPYEDPTLLFANAGMNQVCIIVRIYLCCLIHLPVQTDFLGQCRAQLRSCKTKARLQQSEMHSCRWEA